MVPTTLLVKRKFLMEGNLHGLSEGERPKDGLIIKSMRELIELIVE